MRLQPLHKMVINMMKYGVVLGGIVGAFSALVLIITAQSFTFLSNIVPVMIVEVLSIAVYGMIFGGFFGLISGIYSGISMAIVSKAFFVDIESHQVFRLVMGTITAIVTMIYMVSGVAHLRLDGMQDSTWIFTLLIAVVMAIYASQQVTHTYLIEWTILKRKSYVR